MKKLITLIIFLALSITTVAAPTILSPEEIPILSDTSAEASGLNKLGILIGTDKGFELDRNITRAEAVVLLLRMHPQVTGSIGTPAPIFEDMDGHWAYKEVTAAKKMGLIDGTSATTFTPDRTVSGKEFTKMMLSLLGYTDITIENAYDKGVEHDLILNKFTSSVVYDNRQLLRGDAARICWAALTSKTADGKTLNQKLIDCGKYKAEDFDGVLGCGVPAAVSNATFADKMNAQMPDDKNYMFSPLSIKMAFAMAANGASGETKTQIENALGITDLNAYNEATKSLIEQYNEAEIIQLNVANSIWINSSRTPQRFSKDYSDLLKNYFGAQAYVSDNNNIVKNINGWVNEQTNEKIPSIIDRNDFWAMLINAVYFKGSWENEFSQRATAPDTFTDRNGKKSEIDFMNRTAYFGYYKHENCEIIELPYKNAFYDEKTEQFNIYDMDLSMYLVKGDYTEQVLENDLTSTYVSLSMPKFELDYDTSLSGMMQNLGVTDAFIDGTADFTKMFDGGNMFITDAIHKTYINVDEKGTEAAAVTAIGMEGSSLPPEPIEVKFNVPFTFVIRDNTNGEILFLGEYAFAE